MSKSNKLTIYLLKKGFDDGNILKKEYSKIRIENHLFFTDDSNIRKPTWLSDFFLGKLEAKSELNIANAKGVLLSTIEQTTTKKWFAIVFGSGRHMLKSEGIEERFGLKVTLNSILPDSIKSIDKSTIGAISKNSREQLSKASNYTEFGIDIEQDLVKAVTGSSQVELLGKTITGADALSLSTKVDINTISELLSICLKQFKSKKYKDNFDWVDQIKEVKGSLLKDSLNNSLVEKLNKKEFENIWMSIPEIIDWSDLLGLKYLPYQKKEEYTDNLNISEFVNCIPDGITLEKLRARWVKAISSTTEKEIQSWNAFKCIYGELTIGHEQYVLNNGKWYEVATDFVKLVKDNYNKILISSISLPKYTHTDEGAYNEYVALGNSKLLKMDKKNVMHGGGSNRIEFCDLLSLDNQIIHVKNSGASSVLSHLFQQGVNSGEYFFSDPDFRIKLNNLLEGKWKLKSPKDKIDASKYEVVFAIISDSKDERPRIPFFSQVSIKNAKRRLENMGYKVSLKKISSGS